MYRRAKLKYMYDVFKRLDNIECLKHCLILLGYFAVVIVVLLFFCCFFCCCFFFFFFFWGGGGVGVAFTFGVSIFFFFYIKI